MSVFCRIVREKYGSGSDCVSRSSTRSMKSLSMKDLRCFLRSSLTVCSLVLKKREVNSATNLIAAKRSSEVPEPMFCTSEGRRCCRIERE